jgi:DNA-binding MarR family transcriptional regulator
MDTKLSPTMTGALAYLATDEDGERAAGTLADQGYVRSTVRALVGRGLAEVDVVPTGPNHEDTNLVRVVRLTDAGRAEAERLP